jgi:hypothetical protein
MSWYYGTFSCKHEGRVNITGPVKNRQWIADRKFEGLCPECYEKHLEEERIKANEVAAEKAKEMQLTELQGTEKQVAWANTIRQKFIEQVERKLENIEKRKGNKDLAIKIFNFILINKTEAKWFIDNRDGFDTLNSLEILFKEVKNEIKTEDEIIEEKSAIEVKIEATVKPENATTEIAADIRIQGDKVSVIFDKNEKFRLLVKSLGYKWDGIWCKKINELTGSAEDRVAELGNKLLNAGFPICIMDETIRNNAINGVYEEECDRWIMTKVDEKYKGRFFIKWWEKNDKLYRVSRRLPGSVWENGTIVRMEYYKEVEEFAELYGFKFTKATLKAIEEYVAAKENIEVIAPAKIEKEEPKDGLKEILESSTEVLDDLREDD